MNFKYLQMKQFLLIIFFACTSIAAFTQSRIGFSASEIKTEFWERQYNLKESFDTSNRYYIAIKTKRANVAYVFDEKQFCTITYIFPLDQGALNFYVELYNSRYVVAGLNQWKMYSNGGVSEILLIYPESGGYFFAWRSLNQN